MTEDEKLLIKAKKELLKKKSSSLLNAREVSALQVRGKKQATEVGKLFDVNSRTVYEWKKSALHKIEIQALKENIRDLQEIIKIKKEKGIVEKPEEPITEESSLKERIKEVLKGKKEVSAVDLSNQFNTGIDKITEAIKIITEEGYLVNIVEDKISLGKSIAPPEPITINIKPFYNKWIKFGVVSDAHLNSKYERLGVLNSLYDLFEKEGIKNVFQAGNMIDGFAKFNQFDVFNTGVDEQINYWCEKYPQRKGITTHFITGDDHEGWYVQREHINIGQVMEDTARVHYGREDLHHLGYVEANVQIPVGQKKTVIRIMHPGGGTAYAMSYQPQKIIESLSGGEKPDFLIIGHYHKAESGIIRNVPYIQAGCTEDQTTFMRKKHIMAHIGGWIVELQIAPEGYINRIKTEWIRYFNKKFYKTNQDIPKLTEREWKYKW